MVARRVHRSGGLLSHIRVRLQIAQVAETKYKIEDQDARQKSYNNGK
jgi:hypothetical protein